MGCINECPFCDKTPPIETRGNSTRRWRWLLAHVAAKHTGGLKAVHWDD